MLDFKANFSFISEICQRLKDSELTSGIMKNDHILKVVG